MENKYIGVIIGVAVAIILVGTLLSPVIKDTTATSDTITNDGIFHMGELKAGESWHYVWDGQTLTLNDAVVELPTTELVHGTASIIMMDNIVFRYVPANGAIFINGAISSTVTAFDITAVDGTLTGTRSSSGETTDVNVTYTSFWGIVPDSDYVMCQFPATVLLDTDVFVLGLSLVSESWYMLRVSGSIDGGFSISVLSQANGNVIAGATVTNVAVDSENIDNYVDLASLNKITFDVTIGDVTGACTYSCMIVPEEVTADRADPMGSGEAAILKAIPIIVIVSLILAVIALFVRSRF